MSKAIKIEGGNYIMEEKKINENKIAISASSDIIEGDVDSRFGRCSHFLLITLKNGEMSHFKVIENINKDTQGGAGIAVAEMIAKHNVDSVITGNIGPRALDVLNQFKIDAFKFSGSIKDSLKHFVEKKLNQIR